MLRQQAGERRQGNGFRKAQSFDEANIRRLHLILSNGFGTSSGYSMSRDRYYVHLGEGVTIDRVLAFCDRELGGNPLPATPSGSCALLALFRKAEEAGLVRLDFVKAGQFVPEMRRTSD